MIFVGDRIDFEMTEARWGECEANATYMLRNCTTARVPFAFISIQKMAERRF